MPARNRSIGAIVAIVVGVVLCIVAVAGAAAGWGSSTKTTLAPTTPTTNRNSPSTVSAPSEDVLDFVVRLGKAYSAGDERFLNTRVAVEVTDRYGTTTCVAHFHGAKAPGTAFRPRGKPSPPKDYTYDTDGKQTVVHGVVEVPIDIVQGDQTQPDTVHAVPEADATGTSTYRFFIDCGDPQS